MEVVDVISLAKISYSFFQRIKQPFAYLSRIKPQIKYRINGVDLIHRFLYLQYKHISALLCLIRCSIHTDLALSAQVFLYAQTIILGYGYWNARPTVHTLIGEARVVRIMCPCIRSGRCKSSVR